MRKAARLDAKPNPRAAPNQRKPRAVAARPAVPRTENPDAPLQLPTEAEIAAWVRRRHRPALKGFTQS